MTSDQGYHKAADLDRREDQADIVLKCVDMIHVSVHGDGMVRVFLNDGQHYVGQLSIFDLIDAIPAIDAKGAARALGIG